LANGGEKIRIWIWRPSSWARYGSEINCSVSSFRDNGFTVKLGNEMNGFVADAVVRTPSEAAHFLYKATREHFSDSVYAPGGGGALTGGSAAMWF
jgi:hypothetical protein